MNITFEKEENTVGKDLSQRMKSFSRWTYEKARDFAKGRGILIADTKMEFGIKGGKLIVIDELLTPGSISMTIDGRAYAKEY